MKRELIREYSKIYVELEGLKFPEVLIENAYSSLANFLRYIPIGVIRIITRNSGKKIAQSFKDFLMDRYKITEIKEEDVPMLIDTQFQLSGIGEFESKFEGNKLIIDVKDSFMLRASSDSKIALGLFIGVIEGFVSEFLGKEVVGEVVGKSYILTIKSK